MKLHVIILLLFSASLFAQDIGGDYYVATDGDDDAAGTYAAPWATWQKAFSTAIPGDTVYFRGGVYYPPAGWGYQITPQRATPIGSSGTAANPIYYIGYPGETPILDCRNIRADYGSNNYAILIEKAEFLRFENLTVRNVYGFSGGPENDSMLALGFSMNDVANMRFENVTVHDVSGRAFYYTSGAYDTVAGPSDPLAKIFDYDSTYFINCDAYNLCDTFVSTPGNAADGWWIEGYKDNYFEWSGCRIWNYTDNSVDAFGNQTNVFKNVWSMGSAKYADVIGQEAGGGSGLKVSGSRFKIDDYTSEHLDQFYNCLSVYCPGGGFIVNLFVDHGVGDPAYYYPTNAIMYNSTAYYCTFGVWDSNGNRYDSARNSTYRNNLMYGSTENYEPPFSSTPKDVMIFNNSIYRESHNTWDSDQSNPGYIGFTYATDVTVTDDDFVTVDSLTIVWLFTASRQADGSLPATFPLRLSSDSDLIDAGTEALAVDSLSLESTAIINDYEGTAPDIGAFEYSAPTPTSSAARKRPAGNGNELYGGGDVIYEF